MPVGEIAARVRALESYNKPIVCNEDDRVGFEAAAALRVSTDAGASYGLMLKELNQFYPFEFHGRLDDRSYYEVLAQLIQPSSR